jgi:hypothetical protein
MPRMDIVWALLLATPTAAFANIQPVRNAPDSTADHRQLAVDRGWAERDARELAEFEQMAKALGDACRYRMTGRYREVNTRLQSAMARETEQAAVKSDQAAQEAQLSDRELPDERMEAGVSGDSRDVIQSTDDGRDMNDDVRDRANAFIRHAEMARIATMAGALQNHIDRGERAAMQRNVALVAQFLKVMRSDVAASRTETVEDRIELREDRREGRTDRR